MFRALFSLFLLVSFPAWAINENVGLPKSPSQEIRPAFSPEGKTIAFNSDHSGNWDIYTLDLETGEIFQVVATSARDLVPKWSPDGKQLVFYSNWWGNPWADNVDFDIYTVNVDGTNLTRVTTEDVNDLFPDWSPDGKRILFVSNREGNRNLFYVDADGTNLTPINKQWKNWLFQPKIHWPSGRIVFEGPGPGLEGDQDVIELWLLEADGETVTRLTNNNLIDYNPTISPDGTKVLFERVDENGQGQIMVMDIDGTNTRQLTFEGVNETPDWSPDGTQIIFMREIPRPDDPKVPIDRNLYIMNSDGSNQRELLAW